MNIGGGEEEEKQEGDEEVDMEALLPLSHKVVCLRSWRILGKVPHCIIVIDSYPGVSCTCLCIECFKPD